MRSVFKDVFSVFRSKIVIILFGLLNTIIIARYLGPEINGELTSLLIYPSMFISFGSLGVRKSSAFFIGTRKYETSSIFHSIMHLWYFSSILSIILSFIFMFFFMATRPSISYLLLAILPLPFTLLNNYLSGIFLGRNQIKEFNEVNWIPVVITFIFTFTFLILFNFKLKGVLIANISGVFVMSLILLYKLGINILFSVKVNSKIILEIGKLGLAFAASLFIVNLNYRVDIIIMERLSNHYQIGIYSKAVALTQYLWQIPMLLGTIVFARGSRASDKKLFSLKVSQLLRLSLIFMVISSIILALLSKQIVLLLLGKAFLPSANVILWLLPGVVILTIFKVLHMDISAQGKPLFVFRSMLPAVILNIIMNILMIPKLGAIGAALSSTISYTLGGFVYLWQYSNFTKIPISTIFRYNNSDIKIINSILVHLKLKK